MGVAEGKPQLIVTKQIFQEIPSSRSMWLSLLILL